MSKQADHRTHPEGQVELQNWNIERSKSINPPAYQFVGHHLAEQRPEKKWDLIRREGF